MMSPLQGTQSHGGPRETEAKAEGSIQRLGEGGLEGVDVDQGVSRDYVEGQSASRLVHVHPYPVGDGGGGRGG